MRFDIPRPPKDGSIRAVKAFAWFPVEIGFKYVWLESYWKMQKYRWVLARWSTYCTHLIEVDVNQWT